MGVLAWIAFSFRQIAPQGIVNIRYVADRDGCTGVDRILLQINCTLGDCLHQIRSRQRWVYWRGSHSPSDKLHPRGLFTSDTQQTEMGVLVDQSSILLRCHLLSRFLSVQYCYVAASSPSDRLHPMGLFTSDTQQTEMGVLVGSIQHSPSERQHPRELLTSDTQQTERGVLAWINSAFSFKEIAPWGIVSIMFIAGREGCTGVDQHSPSMPPLSRFRSVQHCNVAASSPSDREHPRVLFTSDMLQTWVY